MKCVSGDSSDAGFVGSLGMFDRILLDPPCTGLGVLRHNPETKFRTTDQDPRHVFQDPDEHDQSRCRGSQAGRNASLLGCAPFPGRRTVDLIGEFLATAPHFQLDPISASEVAVDSFLIDPGFFRSVPALEDMIVDGFFAAPPAAGELIRPIWIRGQRTSAGRSPTPGRKKFSVPPTRALRCEDIRRAGRAPSGELLRKYNDINNDAEWHTDCNN